MRLNPTDLRDIAATYQSIIMESHDETGSATAATPAAQPSKSKQLKHQLFRNWKNLVLGAVARGELSEGLAARNIDSIIEQMWKDTQPVIDHTWEEAQEAYADMAETYASEADQ